MDDIELTAEERRYLFGLVGRKVQACDYVSRYTGEKYGPKEKEKAKQALEIWVALQDKLTRVFD